jgi:hypothetical protein
MRICGWQIIVMTISRKETRSPTGQSPWCLVLGIWCLVCFSGILKNRKQHSPSLPGNSSNSNRSRSWELGVESES